LINVAIAEKNYRFLLPPSRKEFRRRSLPCSLRAFPFHLEYAERAASGGQFARLDEYGLASRLSYALWSSTPDDELMNLATRGELRKNFQAQSRCVALAITTAIIGMSGCSAIASHGCREFSDRKRAPDRRAGA